MIVLDTNTNNIIFTQNHIYWYIHHFCTNKTILCFAHSYIREYDIDDIHNNNKFFIDELNKLPNGNLIVNGIHALKNNGEVIYSQDDLGVEEWFLFLFDNQDAFDYISC